MVKIRTNITVTKSRKGEEAFVSREMTNFNLDDKKNSYTSIVEDIAFIEIQEPVLDENQQPTNETKTVRKELELLRTRAYKFTPEQVSAMFSLVNKDIIASTDNYHNKFSEIRLKALMYDTIQPLQGKTTSIYGTVPENWIVDES